MIFSYYKPVQVTRSMSGKKQIKVNIIRENRYILPEN